MRHSQICMWTHQGRSSRCACFPVRKLGSTPPPPPVSVVQPANLGTADCLAWEPEVITQAILLWISSALLEIPFQFPPVCKLSYTLQPSLWSSVLRACLTLCDHLKPSSSHSPDPLFCRDCDMSTRLLSRSWSWIIHSHGQQVGPTVSGYLDLTHIPKLDLHYFFV